MTARHGRPLSKTDRDATRADWKQEPAQRVETASVSCDSSLPYLCLVSTRYTQYPSHKAHFSALCSVNITTSRASILGHLPRPALSLPRLRCSPPPSPHGTPKSPKSPAGAWNPRQKQLARTSFPDFTLDYSNPRSSCHCCRPFTFPQHSSSLDHFCSLRRRPICSHVDSIQAAA